MQFDLISIFNLELLAVLLALIYLILASRQNIICWYAALVSTSIYTYLYWDVSLYMESLLNVYYFVMAIYGLSQWKKKEKSENSIDIWSFKKHSIIISLIIVLSFISGIFLSETNAENPFLDSFTTWGSVITTYMVAKKILTNWIFWIVINSVGIFLNFDKGLIMTALLLFIYQIISVIGFISWRRSYYKQIG